VLSVIRFFSPYFPAKFSVPFSASTHRAAAETTPLTTVH